MLLVWVFNVPLFLIYLIKIRKIYLNCFYCTLYLKVLNYSIVTRKEISFLVTMITGTSKSSTSESVFKISINCEKKSLSVIIFSFWFSTYFDAWFIFSDLMKLLSAKVIFSESDTYPLHPSSLTTTTLFPYYKL